MGLTNDIRDALDTRITGSDGLSIATAKSFPTFDRPVLVYPTCWIAWRSDSALPQSRVSGGISWRTDFDITLFCRDEVQLMSYVDSLRTMFDNWPQATIGGYVMKISASVERVPQDAETPEALRYAAQSTISFSYVR